MTGWVDGKEVVVLVSGCSQLQIVVGCQWRCWSYAWTLNMRRMVRWMC